MRLNVVGMTAVPVVTVVTTSNPEDPRHVEINLAAHI